jgi:ankyrin repeat protein
MKLSERIADIFKAAQSGEAVRIREILSENPELANAENGDGLTPLGFAAHYGQKEAVLALLEYGAHINALSHSKLSFIPSNTALHAAIAGIAPEIVNLLIHNGADVNAVDSNGNTPIQAAAFEGNIEIAQLLIDNGANVSRKSEFGSALSIAINKGRNEFADLLRQYGALE